ncbi:hypothetical protein BLX42_08980 [Pseudomonas sp. SG-MS2]|uniref:DUF4214 domain-containing protein n=1 Tax=Pseudomonas sp. SG-MS2 TaxID=1914534 RepID=UPI00137AE4C7|nr:DUF4214 domain-containing protein [Pseudomonas sp. SG-MS2]KAF1311402.1 hypothetical protein BLX42_08980 [Pseudomonas sp. SG-MS2]
MSSNTAPKFAAVKTTTKVSVFSQPDLNGSDANPSDETENANLASIIKSVINNGGNYSLDTSIQSFTDPDFATKLASSGFFFMTDMENGNPSSAAFLPDSAKDALESWVGSGGVIMMTGTSGAPDTQFLNTVFGWDLTTKSGASWSLNSANAAGTPFDGGPAILNNLSATDSIGKGTVANFKAIYGTDDDATVAVISYGAGTVIFLGFDYYGAGIAGTGFQVDAPQYLQDVTTGAASTDAWVTEMIPRAMQYSAELSSAYTLKQGGASLTSSNILVVSDEDSDIVTVTATALTAVQKDSSGAIMTSNSLQPSDSDLLGMMTLSPTPVLDGTKVEGSLTWTFDSGNEAFRYLKAGEQLLLEYTLVADDGNGGTEQTTLQLVISGTNDLPTIQGVPVSREAVTVGTPATLANFTVQDVDATELTVSLTAVNGQIGGLSGWTKVGSVWSKTATADVLNAALANATFIATREGDASIEVSVTDETGTAVKTVYDLKAKPTVVNPTVEVDGVNVTYLDAWLPNGDLGRQVDIPVITSGRTEQTGAANVADIPLVQTGNALLLSAQLPIGFGLKAQGGNVSTAANSLANLIESIKAVSAVNNSHDQEHLTSNGSAFLAGLSGDSALLVQTLTPLASSNAAPSAPLVINGSIDANQHTALVIDASSLPASSTLQLNNVDFASVVGAVTVIGSQPGQMLSGDAESQTFVLTGNSGSQVYAGGGNDTIAVNAAAPGASASSSLIHGGSGADTLAFSGARSDYVIEQRDGSVVVTRVDDPSQQTTLINAESLQFSDGNLGVESRSELGLIAGLYHNILGRQADLGGFEYWGQQQSSGSQSLGQIALNMIASSESFAAGHGFTNDIGNDLEVLYRGLFNRDTDAEGRAYWTGQMQDGMSLQEVANSMVGSIEMSANTQRAGEWDFIL